MEECCCTNELTYESVLKNFAPVIKKTVMNVKMQDREDVEQEIKLKILEKFEVLQNVAAPTFFEFLEKN
ncbi:hypothetical protein [Bacillus bombysepticus]|uniref:hypothetical protein n=1 Tax=Bacillus bombysepticus TaxID=658666 RepID=UPI003016FC96